MSSLSKAVAVDYEKDYDSFEKEIKGKNPEDQDSDGEEFDFERFEKPKGRPGERDGDAQGEKKNPDFMFFDFRGGSGAWPSNVEYVDPQRGDTLVQKATEDAEAAIKEKMRETEEEGGDVKKESGSGAVTTEVVDDWDDATTETKTVEKAATKGDSEDGGIHPEARFEVLKDGSTALIIQPGCRLKINLKELLQGGDEMREKRKADELRAKKNASKYSGGYGGYFSYPSAVSGGYGGFDGKDEGKGVGPRAGAGAGGVKGGKEGVGGAAWGGAWGNWKPAKQYINEYTITMDVKLQDEPPREGLSVFQTSLVHVKESKRTGKPHA